MTATTMHNRDPRTESGTFDAVFTEVQSLFHRMGAAVAQIHGQGELTGGRRGVMRDIYRQGPRTVPQMARARPVSRQHIQSLVNGLLSDGLVEYIHNPAHKRSKLVRLTASGKETIEAMVRREGELLEELDIDVSEDDLRTTAEVLRTIREAFESEGWRKILEAGQ